MLHNSPKMKMRKSYPLDKTIKINYLLLFFPPQIKKIFYRRKKKCEERKSATIRNIVGIYVKEKKLTLRIKVRNQLIF